MLKFTEQKPSAGKSVADLFGKKKDTKQDVLHGSGLTSREAIKAEKTLERQERDAEKVLADEQIKINKAVVDPAAQPETISMGAPSDIVWDDYQLAALKGLENEQFGCIVGAAGTGKTTVEKELIRRLQANMPLIRMNATRPEHLQKEDDLSMNVAVAFCAFTGRATQQMKKVLPVEYHSLCQTIHATLGYMPFDEEYYDKDKKEFKTKRVFRPTFTASNKLPYKTIVIDESGMLPINLFNEVMEAVEDDCRIILIGDINQLPPVQGRSVLGFAMLKWPTYTLEHIHRQAADNPIIANAHKILQGLFPQKVPGRFDIKSLPAGSQATHASVVKYIKKLSLDGDFDPITDAFIVPQNKDMLGKDHFNEYFVQHFNPPKEDDDGNTTNRREIIRAGRTNPMFAVGDKVMLLQNDRERNLTNGMTGVITEINLNGRYRGDHHQQVDDFDFEASSVTFDMNSFVNELDDQHAETQRTANEQPEEEEDENKRQASHVVTVKFTTGQFETEVQFSTSGQFTKLTHAYAFTCHKSQGGEYPTVVIVCHSANSIMLNREWLYTAVTRAQERVILLCNDRGIAKAVRNQTIKGNTVAEKAQSFLALQDKSDTKVPNLPEPQKLTMEAAE